MSKKSSLRHEFTDVVALVFLCVSEAGDAVAHAGVPAPGSRGAASRGTRHDECHILGHQGSRGVKIPLFIAS